MGIVLGIEPMRIATLLLFTLLMACPGFPQELGFRPPLFQRPLFQVEKFEWPDEPRFWAYPDKRRLFRHCISPTRKSRSLSDALLIILDYDMGSADFREGKHTLIGIRGQWTDSEMAHAVRLFYEEWKPPVDRPDAEPPNALIMSMNWGVGMETKGVLSEASLKFGFDVWDMPIDAIATRVTANHPTTNDAKLAEILRREARKAQK